MARVVFDPGPGKLGQLQAGEKLQVVLERVLVGANFEHSGKQISTRPINPRILLFSWRSRVMPRVRCAGESQLSAG
jgi:hypothetical protein